jgi:hypothetical protein
MSPMMVPFTILLGVAVIVLVCGLVSALKTHLQSKRDESMSAGDGDDISTRLDEVEARLRDVLDVMIAVSETMDRWERDGVPAADAQRAVSR